jgi:hypothetical protein
VNLDSFSKIGKAHIYNQDYTAISPNKSVLTLCDGCSSAQFSDIGSRLIACAALSYDTLHSTIWAAYTAGNTINLPIDALSATLIRIRVIDGIALIEIAGDGTIVSIPKEGPKALSRENICDYTQHIRFPSNAPYYLRYNLSEKDRQKYLELYGDLVTEKDHSYDLLSKWPDGIIKKNINVEDVNLIAVFSDGISSFQDSNGNKVSEADLVSELTSFKNYSGQFVQRRCRKAFSEFDKKGWRNLDDFSMGVIHFNTEAAQP